MTTVGVKGLTSTITHIGQYTAQSRDYKVKFGEIKREMELHRASSSSSYGVTVSARSDIHNNLYATICQSEHKREQNRNSSKILRHFKQNVSDAL